MRVLLVEDSEKLRRSVSTGLRKAGFAVDVAGDGEAALWYATGNEYDVIVLDLMLPKVDGLTVLRRLREMGKTTHVLILTARDTVEDRVLGLRSGSDDYLIKPFAFEELLARIEALGAARAWGEDAGHPDRGGGDRFGSSNGARGGGLLDLTPREFALLEYLAMRRGEVVTRSQIEGHIYDEQVDPMSNVVDAAVYSLRKKIDTPGEPVAGSDASGHGVRP